MSKIYKNTDKDPLSPDYFFVCPGCNEWHGIWTTKINRQNAIWYFNGDFEKPTVIPSLNIKIDFTDHNTKTRICHSIITDGKIEYLTNCTHFLVGQTVEIPEFE
jgi:hypothetical protein